MNASLTYGSYLTSGIIRRELSKFALRIIVVYLNLFFIPLRSIYI